jgi:lysophospholipase L1-like esterase
MNIQDMINNNDYTVILCFGDSITEANHCTEGYLGYAALLDEELRIKFKRGKFLLINAGIGGTRATNSIDYVKKHMERFKPDLTTVMYGMNDSAAGKEGLQEFREAMNEIVKIIRANDSELVLLTQNPVDYSCDIEPIQRRPFLPEYMEAVRACASETKTELVDINAAWKSEVLDKDNNEHFKLLHDGIHPNQHGHRYIFEQIKKHLMPE